MDISVKNIIKNKIISPEDPILLVKNGQTIFIGSSAAEPIGLTDTLLQMAERYWDLRIFHTIISEKS